MTGEHLSTLAADTVIVVVADTYLADSAADDDTTAELLSMCDDTFEFFNDSSLLDDASVRTKTPALPAVPHDAVFGMLVMTGTDEAQLAATTLPATELTDRAGDTAVGGPAEVSVVLGNKAVVDKLEENRGTKLLEVSGTEASINVGRPDTVCPTGCIMLPVSGDAVCGIIVLAGILGLICTDTFVSPVGSLAAYCRGIAVIRSVPAFNVGRIAATCGAVRGAMMVLTPVCDAVDRNDGRTGLTTSDNV